MRALLRSLFLAVVLAGCDRPSVLDDCRVVQGKQGATQWMMCLPPEHGFPPWNRDLVVYAHGYVDPNKPLDFQDLSSPAFSSLPETVLGLGYAFATTTYPENGLVRDGVADVTALTEAFWAEVGGGRGRSYLIGASEGGMVTTLAVEQHPTTFSGGLALCGPIGDFRAQVDYFGDFRVLFDYFFPGVLPGTAIDIPEELIAHWETRYVPAVEAALAANPAAARQLMSTTKARFDPTRPGSITQTAIDVLWYNVFATNDAKAKLHGNPFGNMQTWYFGSEDDLKLNRSVARFLPSPVALHGESLFQTTGELSVPLVTMHTAGDAVVPSWHEALYAKKVQKRSPGKLTQLSTPAFGHCDFKPEELLGAFGVLVVKAHESGSPKPKQAGLESQSGAEHGRHYWGTTQQQ